jgi:hypothetical protein
LASRRRTHQQGEHRQQEELARQPVEQPVDHPAQPLGDRERRGDEGDRLADEAKRLPDSAAAARGKAEHEPDHEVLGDENRQHHVGLVVRQATEVDQPLDRDRARGDVDPCRGHTNHETERPIREEVDRPADEGVLAAANESAERELEAEEEEQKHEPDLGDEIGHLGRANQAQYLRLVRPEQQPGEKISRDRGQAHAARDQPKAGEQRDRDRELRERHRLVGASLMRPLRFSFRFLSRRRLRSLRLAVEGEQAPSRDDEDRQVHRRPP